MFLTVAYFSQPQLEVLDRFNAAINNITFDLNEENNIIENENIIPPANCKYYTIDEFHTQTFNSDKHFSILHLNISSIEYHIEEFRIVLELLKHKFDFICISESKIRTNREPKVDIKIEGSQQPIGMSTDSSKGGVLIYIREGINYKPREDLNMHKSKELESYFIESINQKGKNSIIGIIYRHPCMEENLFIEEYMKPLNDRLSAENKNIYIAGDFNIDFLNISNKESSNFFETMMSNFLLPVITLPTKINPKKHTVIDNIFTNQVHPEMKSGNIHLHLRPSTIIFYLT